MMMTIGKRECVIKTDMVVHGAGRVPDIEGLDLEAAQIEYDHKKGIKINDTCRAFQILRYMLLGM